MFSTVVKTRSSLSGNEVSHLSKLIDQIFKLLIPASILPPRFHCTISPLVAALEISLTCPREDIWESCRKCKWSQALAEAVRGVALSISPLYIYSEGKIVLVLESHSTVSWDWVHTPPHSLLYEEKDMVGFGAERDAGHCWYSWGRREVDTRGGGRWCFEGKFTADSDCRAKTGFLVILKKKVTIGLCSFIVIGNNVEKHSSLECLCWRWVAERVEEYSINFYPRYVLWGPSPILHIKTSKANSHNDNILRA